MKASEREGRRKGNEGGRKGGIEEICDKEQRSQGRKEWRKYSGRRK